MKFRFLLPLVCILTSQAQTAPAPGPQLQERVRYQLHAGDQINLEYTYTPEFNETVIVPADGVIPLKVGKDVQVLGKTADEAKALVIASAGDRLQDPVVVLTITDFQKPYFVVAGEAFAPQKYELRENLTVLQALMLAGGVKLTGKEKEIVLLHGVGTTHPEVHVLDLSHIDKQAIFEHDRALSANDIIFIPRNKITKAAQIMGLITSPASYASTATYALR
jgi:polysaccharide export outer membrane protein